ncbi:hypothetical protein KI387_029226, partial [Taxus chinensis]
MHDLLSHHKPELMVERDLIVLISSYANMVSELHDLLSHQKFEMMVERDLIMLISCYSNTLPHDGVG